MDKTTWGLGPWQDEADRAHWVDPATSLDCVFVRTDMGHLCGYVGLPEGHALHGADPDEADDACGDWPHGGFTYGREGNEYVPGVQGLDAGLWWLGFDCAHGGDSSPGSKVGFLTTGTYRDVGYVKAEVARMAGMVAAAAALEG